MWKFLAAHNSNIWPNFIQKLQYFWTKPTIVCPKSVSWRSNQEWSSICVDTVCKLKFKCWIDIHKHKYCVEVYSYQHALLWQFTFLNYNVLITCILPTSIALSLLFGKTSWALIFYITSKCLKFSLETVTFKLQRTLEW